MNWLTNVLNFLGQTKCSDTFVSHSLSRMCQDEKKSQAKIVCINGHFNACDRMDEPPKYWTITASHKRSNTFVSKFIRSHQSEGEKPQVKISCGTSFLATHFGVNLSHIKKRFSIIEKIYRGQNLYTWHKTWFCKQEYFLKNRHRICVYFVRLRRKSKQKNPRGRSRPTCL